MNLLSADVDVMFLRKEGIRFYNELEKINPSFLKDVVFSDVFTALLAHTKKPFADFFGGNGVLQNENHFKSTFFFSVVKKILEPLTAEQRILLFNTAIKQFEFESAKDLLEINHWLEEVNSGKKIDGVKLSFSAMKLMMLLLEQSTSQKNELFAKRYGFSVA